MAIQPQDVPDEVLAAMSDDVFEAWLDARFQAHIASVYSGIAQSAAKIDAILTKHGGE